jgi:hypothetical protein
MATETRTEYAIKGTALRHGKQKVVIEAIPGNVIDPAATALLAEKRAWQKSVGITPDAEIVFRTITVTDWM